MCMWGVHLTAYNLHTLHPTMRHPHFLPPPPSVSDPPLSSPPRCIPGLHLCAGLEELGRCGSVGLTCGVAYCGAVGHKGNRREYSVLGDVVNLSARLMQYCGSTNEDVEKGPIKTWKGGVVNDVRAKEAARGYVSFQNLGTIKVKGKANELQIFRPYPEGDTQSIERLSASEAEAEAGWEEEARVGNEDSFGAGSLMRDKKKSKGVLAKHHSSQVESYNSRNLLLTKAKSFRRRRSEMMLQAGHNKMMAQVWMAVVSVAAVLY